MKIYDSKMAPNPRRVTIFLAEKGIDVARHPIDVMKQEHRQEPYRSLFPNGRVPALELDDGEVLAESVAICRYFEETNPEHPLFGTSPIEKARVEMWNRRMELELFFPLAYLFRHTHPAMSVLEKQIPEYGEGQKKAVIRGLKMLDKRLQESKYVAGDSYSIADITAQCAVEFFVPLVRMEIPKDHPALQRWWDEVSARPSAQVSKN